jgi:NitT/TauT family transport system permease protein
VRRFGWLSLLNDSPKPDMRSQFKGWFRVREDLSPGRQTFLTVLSFLVPIAVWCFVSYTPWIWHPDIELDVSAERVGITTVYVAGDHLSREFFPGFQQAVRDENSAIVESRSTSDEPAEPSRSARRSNQRVLRQLASVAIENGWLPRDDRENDALIYEVWRDIATGRKKAIAPALSDENLEIARSNWAILEAKSLNFNAAELPGRSC